MRAAGDRILGDTGIGGEEAGDEVVLLPRIGHSGDDYGRGIKPTDRREVRLQITHRAIVGKELLVDERADAAQLKAIHTLVKGEAGGPWGVLGWTWPTLHGLEAVPYELELDGIHSRVRAGEAFELELEPIRNPVSGAEVTPGRVLPQGIVFKRGDFASSKRYRVGPLGIDYAGKYAAVAPFVYAGP